MASSDMQSRELRSFRIRRKADETVADPSRSEVDGNSFDITIGGTASDGNYVATLTPSDGTPAIAITVVRDTTPASNTDIATQFVVEAQALIDAGAVGDWATLAAYIESVSSSGAVATCIVRKGAKPFTIVTSETTATGTITVSPDDTFPIGFDAFGQTSHYQPRTVIEWCVLPVNSAGVQLPAGTLTVDVTFYRYFDRAMRDAYDRPTTTVGVGSVAVETAAVAGALYRTPAGGGRYVPILSAVSGAVGSGTLAALEVWARETTE